MHDHEVSRSEPEQLDELLGDLVDEVTAKFNAGQPVDVDSYIDRDPRYAEEIRELIGTLRAVGHVGQVGGAPRRDDGQASPQSDSPPPGVLGDFRIVREIGRGGMGVVYEAEQISLGRRVALKVLPYAAVMDPRQLARFKTEAQAAASLHHSNIVPVFFVGSDRGIHHYAMQFIEGQSLCEVISQLQRSSGFPAALAANPTDMLLDSRSHDVTDYVPSDDRASGIDETLEGSDWLQRHSPQVSSSGTSDTRPVAAITTDYSADSTEYCRFVAELGIQAAEALDHAHARGVLHRDIKPGNLMLDSLNHLWVTDFGLARLDGDVRMTVSGDLIGTLRYMSPEQALAKRVIVDQRTDIYSLGVTLYELLTLQPAYDGSDREELLRQIAFDEPRPPRRLNRAIPIELDTIVTKSMAKNPLERYETAGELADDLRRFMNDESILARRPTPFQRLTKWSRRHKPLVRSLSASAALMLITIGIASTMVAARERAGHLQEARLREQIETQGRKTSTRLAESYLQQGQDLSEQGDCASGMLWMARSLRTAPEEAVELKRVIRNNLAAWYRQLTPLDNVLLSTDPIHAVAYSPDGSRVIVAAGKVARICDAVTGQVVGELRGHQEAISAIAWNPNGSTIVTGSWDTTAWVWDVHTMKPVGQPIRHHLLTGPKRFLHLRSPELESDEFSNRTGLVIGILDIAFSPDGTQFVTCANRPSAQVWDAATLAPLGPPMKHEKGVVSSVAYSPDGSRVLTGGMGGYARLWDARSGEQVGEINVRTIIPRGVRYVAFSPDGAHILTGSRGPGFIDRWDATTLKHLGHVSRPGPVLAGACSPDGSMLAISDLYSSNMSRIWNAESGASIGNPLRHRNQVRSHAFRPDGSQLVTGSLDGTARIWAVPQSAPMGGAFDQLELTLCAAFSPDGSRAVMGLPDGSVEIRNVVTGELIGEPLEPEPNWHTVAAAAFSPDGSRIATGDMGRTARIRDAETLQPIGGPLRHKNSITAVVFSPDGSLLCTASADKTARLWNAANATPMGDPLMHDAGVMRVAFTADGSQLLTADLDGTVRRWNTINGIESATDVLRGQGRASISSDGLRICTKSVDGLGQIWDAATGNRLARGHFHGVSGIWHTMIFSPDGRWILASAAESEPGALHEQVVARFYDMVTGQQVGPPISHTFDRGVDGFQGGMRAVAFCPDGSSVLVSGEGATSFWPVPPPAVQGHEQRIALWTQVITGMELDDGDVARVLDGATWHQRRLRLEELGGPPVP